MKILFSDNYETFRRCEFYDSSRDAGCNDDVKTGIDVRNLKKITLQYLFNSVILG